MTWLLTVSNNGSLELTCVKLGLGKRSTFRYLKLGVHLPNSRVIPTESWRHIDKRCMLHFWTRFT